MKIALVHDYLNQMGGAENLLEQLCELFPQAPVYTSVVDKSKLRESFGRVDVKHSFIQKLPFVEKHFKKYLPLYPMAFERMRLSGYDVILSISSGFAKGVSFEPGCLHVNYCLTPMRFAWMFKEYNEKERIPFYYIPLLYPLLGQFKRWDLEKNRTVHKFLTLSQAVRTRIHEWYHRDSDIVYPPVDVKKFTIAKDPTNDFYLVVSRLRGYKRIDLAVRACSALKKRLVVIGEGDHRKALEKIAGPTVKFLGYQNDEVVIRHMQNCKAFFFPGEEDFGIAPLEAQACGRPVIAFKAGGALDTIIDGETGVLFDRRQVDSVIAAIERFEAMTFDEHRCRSNALRFSNEHFKNSMKNYLESALAEHRQSAPR